MKSLGGGNPFEMLASMGTGGMGPNMQSQLAGLMGMQGMGMQGMQQGMGGGNMPMNNSQLSNMGGRGMMEEDDEVAAEDEEDMGVIETYSNYKPSKLKVGRPHPDPVVETASLASVESADVWYQLSLPEDCINERKLSALQLESIVYASQQHEQILPDGNRAGFLIVDGAGVGKGRTIAGVIYENYLKGRKRAIWVSVSNDLKYDAERDLSDIGATGVEVFSL